MALIVGTLKLEVSVTFSQFLIMTWFLSLLLKTLSNLFIWKNFAIFWERIGEFLGKKNSRAILAKFVKFSVKKIQKWGEKKKKEPVCSKIRPEWTCTHQCTNLQMHIMP